MQLTFQKVHASQNVASNLHSSCRRSRGLVVVQARGGRNNKGPAGFVQEDNSGRSNIFAVEPKTLYTKSPTADRAARQGLGGSQGLIVVGVAVGIVLLATLGVARGGGDSLVANGESLTSLAARISSSL